MLDEHLNWRLARTFSEAHTVRSVRGMGWAGKRNGELLRAAEQAFDVLVTMDTNLEHQQRLPHFNLAVILLIAPSNRIEDTEPLVPEIERVLSEGIEAGRLYRVPG